MNGVSTSVSVSAFQCSSESCCQVKVILSSSLLKTLLPVCSNVSQLPSSESFSQSCKDVTACQFAVTSQSCAVKNVTLPCLSNLVEPTRVAVHSSRLYAINHVRSANTIDLGRCFFVRVLSKYVKYACQADTLVFLYTH